MSPLPHDADPLAPEQETAGDLSDSDLELARLAGWLLANDSTPGSNRTPYLSRFGDGSGAPPSSLVPTGRWLAPGDRVGRFRIEGELGRGGFGVVYRAVDESIGRAVALKVPRPDRLHNEALWEQFARDANLLGKLSDPAIVTVYEAGVVDGVFLIVSELVEGQTLTSEIAAHPEGMPPRRAARIALEVARALAHAHERKVLHRDVKPGNILMARSGPDGTPSPRITDFGLGSLMEASSDASTSLSGLWQGSPPYIAPEQLLPGEERIDGRVDVYALGAVLHEMLTGRPIYSARSIVDLIRFLSEGTPPPTPRSINPRVPRDLETICLACLELSPSRRYVSAGELADELERFLAGRPVRRRPLAAWERVVRWGRREPALAALAVVTVVAAVVLALLSGSLAETNRRLMVTVAAEKQASAELRTSRDHLSRAVYTSDLRFAAEAIEGGQAEIAQGLLDALRPSVGEPDPREFTRRMLKARATREIVVKHERDFPWSEPASTPINERSGLDGFTEIRPDFIARNGGMSSACYDGQLRRLFGAEHPAPGRTSQLVYADSRRVVPLDLNHFWSAFGPGKRVALASLPGIAPSRSVPTLKRGMLEIPADGTTASAERFELFEVPFAHSLDFSADASVLAVLATDQSRLPAAYGFPVFYDLHTGEGWGLPDLCQPMTFEWARTSGRGGVHRAKAEMTISPDGRLAALSGWEPRLIVFETRTGRRLWTIEPEATGDVGFIGSAAFSADNRWLVTGDLGERVRLWDVASGRLIAKMPQQSGTISSVGFYPDDGTVLVTYADDDQVRLWNLNPRPDYLALPGHAPGAEIWDLRFTANGESLISCDDLGKVHVWDPRRLVLKATLPDARKMVSALAVSPDGKWLASGDYDGHVLLHNLEETGRPGTAIAHAEGTVWWMEWSPDGSRLAICGRLNTLFLWDRDSASLRHAATPHQDSHALAWRPDGKVLAVGSHDEMITFWGPATLSVVGQVPTSEGVSSLAYSPDGTMLVAGDISGVIQARQANDPERLLWTSRASNQGGVWSLAFTSDSRTLATAGDDGFVRLWDPSTGRETVRLPRHADRAHAVAFSSDGSLLATSDFSGQIRLWPAPRAE